MDRQYVVLGDVVDSRAIEDRRAFRETLANACERLGEEHAASVAAGFTSLKGIDEVVGVLSSAAPIYDVVDGFRGLLHPHEIRIAVAAGGIDVGVDANDPARMDGPAFHRADELLTELDETAFRFALDLEDPPVDALVADQINLLLFRKRRWTDRQREVIALYERLGSQDAVAGELGISQPAVSRVIERAEWEPIREIEHRLRATLERYE